MQGHHGGVAWRLRYPTRRMGRAHCAHTHITAWGHACQPLAATLTRFLVKLTNCGYQIPTDIGSTSQLRHQGATQWIQYHPLEPTGCDSHHYARLEPRGGSNEADFALIAKNAPVTRVSRTPLSCIELSADSHAPSTWRWPGAPMRCIRGANTNGAARLWPCDGHSGQL